MSHSPVGQLPLPKKEPRPIEDLEPLEVRLEIILKDPQGASACLLAEGKRVLYPMNPIESTMLSFEYSGCANFTHIKTVYDHYLASEREKGAKLLSATIEGRHGDMFYARLAWEGKRSRYYNQWCVGDAMILAKKAGVKTYILKKVFDSMDTLEDLEEWPYDDEIIADP